MAHALGLSYSHVIETLPDGTERLSGSAEVGALVWVPHFSRNPGLFLQRQQHLSRAQGTDRGREAGQEPSILS